jgi:hypothetical protein
LVLELNRSKELFSDAYVRAVVSAARMHIEPRTVDVDSVDGYIHYSGWIGQEYSPQIAYQLKCTGVPSHLRANHLAFPLKVKNFNDLRVESGVPRILIVVAVPEQASDWVLQDEVRLRVHRCGYWISLRGRPPTLNVRSCTIKIPRIQQFTVSALRDMMTRVGNGGYP